jgi:hypothetical protein
MKPRAGRWLGMLPPRAKNIGLGTRAIGTTAAAELLLDR